MARINDIDCFLDDAKCCSAKMAAKYLNNFQHGEDQNHVFNELVLLRGYIKSLDRYCGTPEPEEKITFQTLPDGRKIFIPIDGKLVPLTKKTTREVDVDEVNCLTVREVEKIKEGVSKICNNCNC